MMACRWHADADDADDDADDGMPMMAIADADGMPMPCVLASLAILPCLAIFCITLLCHLWCSLFWWH
jgi:hypothetical protein